MVAADRSLQLIAQDVFQSLSAQDKKMMWMIRSHFASDPRALPKVISAAPLNRPIKLMDDTVGMAAAWAEPSPTQALELLHAKFSDIRLRRPRRAPLVLTAHQASGSSRSRGSANSATTSLWTTCLRWLSR